MSHSAGNEDGFSLDVERCTEPDTGDVRTDLLEINACLRKLPLQDELTTTCKFVGAYVGSEGVLQALTPAYSAVLKPD